jgi:chromosome segregation ATPase
MKKIKNLFLLTFLFSAANSVKASLGEGYDNNPNLKQPKSFGHEINNLEAIKEQIAFRFLTRKNRETLPQEKKLELDKYRADIDRKATIKILELEHVKASGKAKEEIEKKIEALKSSGFSVILEKKLEDLENKLITYQKEKNETVAKIKELENRILENRQIDSLKIQKFEKNLKQTEEDLLNLNQQKKTFEEDVSAKNLEIKTLEKKLTEAEEKFETLKEDLGKAKEAFEEFLKSKDFQIKEAEYNIKKLNDLLQKMETDQEQFKLENENHIKAIEDSLLEKNNEVEDLEKKLTETQEKLLNLEKERDSLRNDLDENLKSKDLQITDLLQKMETDQEKFKLENENHIKEIEESLLAKNNEVEDLEKKLTEAEEKLLNLEKERDSLRNDLDENLKSKDLQLTDLLKEMETDQEQFKLENENHIKEIQDLNNKIQEIEQTLIKNKQEFELNFNEYVKNQQSRREATEMLAFLETTKQNDIEAFEKDNAEKISGEQIGEASFIRINKEAEDIEGFNNRIEDTHNAIKKIDENMEINLQNMMKAFEFLSSKINFDGKAVNAIDINKAYEAEINDLNRKLADFTTESKKDKAAIEQTFKQQLDEVKEILKQEQLQAQKEREAHEEEIMTLKTELTQLIQKNKEMLEAKNKVLDEPIKETKQKNEQEKFEVQASKSSKKKKSNK